MPMKLINSKSILDCDEIEEEVHNQENNEFIEKLFNLPDYECAALFKRTDMNDADSEVTIKPCGLHDCFEMVEYVDAKNGVDIFNDGGFITFIVYGQHYKKNDKFYNVQHAIQIRPFDNNREYVYIIND